MKYARINERGQAVDVTTDDPATRFPAALAAEFQEVPDQVERGWVLSEGEWSAPLVPEPGPQTPTGNYRPLSKIEFVQLVQMAGSVSDAQLVAAYKDSNLEALWLKLGWVNQFYRDNPDVEPALDALVATGYLDANGKTAVLANWPQE